MTARFFPHLRWWKELSLALAIALVLGLALALLLSIEVAGQDPGQNALQPPAVGWVVGCIDCPHYFADLTRQAAQADSQGVIHVVYGGDALYHAWNTPTGWQVEVADAQPGVGRYAALAIDSRDRLHAVYFDDQARGLRYAVREAGQWQSEAIQATGVFTANPYPTIGVGPDGYPQIAYYQPTTGRLYYRVRTDLGWYDELVDSRNDVGKYASLVVDTNNNPHLAYYDATNGDLRYAVRTGRLWTTVTVDANGNAGEDLSLALDNSNRAHIVARFAYYVQNGLGWQVEDLTGIFCGGSGGCGAQPVLRLDPAGNPVMAYTNITVYARGYIKTSVVVARRTEGIWRQSEEFGSGSRDPLLVLAGDAPHVFASATMQLAEYVQTGAGWQATIIDQGGDVGRESSLAIDAANRGHVSAYDIGAGTYIYGLRSASAWAVMPFSPTTSGSVHTVLGVDGAGWPHILYWDPVVFMESINYIVQKATGWSVVATFGSYPTSDYDMVTDPTGTSYFVTAPMTERLFEK